MIRTGDEYRNFDFDGPLAFVKQSAGLSDRVMGAPAATSGAPA